MLQKPAFALPGCQRMSVNTLLCDILGLAEICQKNISRICAGANAGAALIILPRYSFNTFGKYLLENDSCIRASANTGPSCIRPTLSSCMYWFCAGRYSHEPTRVGRDRLESTEGTSDKRGRRGGKGQRSEGRAGLTAPISPKGQGQRRDREQGADWYGARLSSLHRHALLDNQATSSPSSSFSSPPSVF